LEVNHAALDSDFGAHRSDPRRVEVGSIPARPGQPVAPPPVLPFVTISREVGSGAWDIAQRLVEALNQDLPDPQHPWTAWDRELVEKVAADLHLSDRLIHSLWDSSHSWLNEMLSSLSFNDQVRHADEVHLVHKVVGTVRALAQAGRVILVGRGAVLVTRQMPGGVHVRLIAPLADRIRHMAEFLGVSPDDAARHVREMSRSREQFYHRYWPSQPISPELFAAMLNTSQLSPAAVVDVIRNLIRHMGEPTCGEQRAPVTAGHHSG